MFSEHSWLIKLQIWSYWYMIYYSLFIQSLDTESIGTVGGLEAELSLRFGGWSRWEEKRGRGKIIEQKEEEQRLSALQVPHSSFDLSFPRISEAASASQWIKCSASSSEFYYQLGPEEKYAASALQPEQGWCKAAQERKPVLLLYSANGAATRTRWALQKQCFWVFTNWAEHLIWTVMTMMACSVMRSCRETLCSQSARYFTQRRKEWTWEAFKVK